VTRFEVMRVPVDSLAEDDIPAVVQALTERKEVTQIALIRWWDFMRARWDGVYQRALRDADVVAPVSRSVVLAARFLRKVRLSRYMPFDLVIRVLGALEDRNRTAYILGGSPGTLRVVEQNLRQTYPGLRFVGRYTGFYPKRVEPDIITAIRKADPDFVLIGPGVPGADKWVTRHKRQLPSSIFLAAPEVFEIFAERRQRVSRTTFRRGLDFVPDLIRRPWRLLRFFVYLWFLVLLVVFRVFRL